MSAFVRAASRRWPLFAATLGCCLAVTMNARAQEERSKEDEASVQWGDDYMAAYGEAQEAKQFLLINFEGDESAQRDLDAVIERDEALRAKLTAMTLVRVPRDVEVEEDGKLVKLLDHAAFAEMHGRPGLAIIDLANEDEDYYADVVSAYPFMSSKYYRWRPEYLKEIVDLPAGTITQRTMVWAVRIHPEDPASTRGRQHTTLARAAESHSRLQARIQRQGHHNWNSRFQQISSAGGGSASEVVAESWPNQTMIDSCIDCVDSWRHSPGHWRAVRSRHRSYGYDIRRGRNGIWYGTGIFTD